MLVRHLPGHKENSGTLLCMLTVTQTHHKVPSGFLGACGEPLACTPRYRGNRKVDSVREMKEVGGS